VDHSENDIFGFATSEMDHSENDIVGFATLILRWTDIVEMDHSENDIVDHNQDQYPVKRDDGVSGPSGMFRGEIHLMHTTHLTNGPLDASNPITWSPR
jgi:hypothetical protein